MEETFGLDLFEVLYTINRLNQELVAYHTLPWIQTESSLFAMWRVTPFETFTLYELLVIGSKLPQK